MTSGAVDAKGHLPDNARVLNSDGMGKDFILQSIHGWLPLSRNMTPSLRGDIRTSITA